METLLSTFTPSYYRKALEKALQWAKSNNEVINEVVFDIFPEIREYEHNRIKNEIISTLKYAQESGGILSEEKFNEYINWLEAQEMPTKNEYVPKDGDIVFAKAKIKGKPDSIRIFCDKDDEEGRSWSYCSLLCYQDEKKMYFNPLGGYISLCHYDIQKATEEQKNLLLNQIIEYGFYWNTTEKVLKRIKKH